MRWPSLQRRVQVKLAPRFVQRETSLVSIVPEMVNGGAVTVPLPEPPPGNWPGENSGMDSELELSRSSRPAYELSAMRSFGESSSQSLPLRS